MPIQRSEKEQLLLDKAQQYLPGGMLGNQKYPHGMAFVAQEAKGSRLRDVSGNEYIDFLLGSGPMFLGHAHPTVTNSVREYLDRGSTYFVQNEPAILLAEQIVQAVPCAEQVRFTTSGSDSTFQCLRLARAHRKRDKVLKFEGGYHGSSDYGMMSVTPINPKALPDPTPGSPGVPRAIEELVLVAPFNNIEVTSDLIERHHDELAAVIVEPCQRVQPPAPGFLEALRAITKQYEIPLIFDEVVTGFRFAYGGAQEFYGVVPDLAAYGKIVGGGFPLGAIAGQEQIMRHFNPIMEESGEYVPQVGTLNGNPIAATAGLATLRVLEKDRTLYSKAFDVGHKLKQSLQEILDQAEIPARVIGEDVVFDVYFTNEELPDYRSTLKADTRMFHRFNRLLLENGVLKGTIKFYVGACHTEQDVDEALISIKKVVGELSD